MRTAKTISAAAPASCRRLCEWFVKKKSQGRRPRHSGQRPSAGDRHRPAAQRSVASAPREEYRECRAARLGDDFPEWELFHRILFKAGILGIENVGGDIDKVTGRRCTFAYFPWNWDRGDGCIVRLVAIIDPKGSYRIERGGRF